MQKMIVFDWINRVLAAIFFPIALLGIIWFADTNFQGINILLSVLTLLALILCVFFPRRVAAKTLLLRYAVTVLIACGSIWHARDLTSNFFGITEKLINLAVMLFFLIAAIVFWYSASTKLNKVVES
jgi:hypothetical protein